MEPLFILAMVLSFALSGVLGAAMITYVVRTWQIIRSQDGDDRDDRILDGIDHIQNGLYLLKERIERLEEAALAPSGDPEAFRETEPGPEVGVRSRS